MIWINLSRFYINFFTFYDGGGGGVAMLTFFFISYVNGCILEFVLNLPSVWFMIVLNLVWFGFAWLSLLLFGFVMFDLPVFLSLVYFDTPRGDG